MGKIILINTPIGNLEDLTPRVLKALQGGVYFAVEDTRVFKDLLGHLGISFGEKKIYSWHDQSEEKSLDFLLTIAEENDLFLASEAGSPMISDPAYPLIKAAYERGINVDTYSGVSSVVVALELSGLPPIPFSFQGFLPREEEKKKQIFSTLMKGTHVFFEAPTRIIDTLDLLAQVVPDVDVALCRELTKKFQQVLKFQAKDWHKFKPELVVKGEFVLCLYQKNEREVSRSGIGQLAQEILERGATPKLVSKLIGELTDKSPKEVYQLLQTRQKE